MTTKNVTAQDMIKKLDKKLDEIKFVVAFNKEGEAIEVIEGPLANCSGKGKLAKGRIPIKDILDMEEKPKYIKSLSYPILYVDGSPGCYILTASGKWIYIC